MKIQETLWPVVAESGFDIVLLDSVHSVLSVAPSSLGAVQFVAEYSEPVGLVAEVVAMVAQSEEVVLSAEVAVS